MADLALADLALGLLFGLLTGIVLQYFVDHLATRRDETNRRRDAALRLLKEQLTELYGPLYGSMQQSKAMHDVAMEVLPTTNGQVDMNGFDKDWHGEDAGDSNTRDKWGPQSRFWNDLVKHGFIPQNEEMARLVKEKVHLLEGRTMPESFKAFLRHEAQLRVRHGAWEREGVDTSQSGDSKRWPPDFNHDVEASLGRLAAEYRKMLDEATGHSPASRGSSPDAT